MIDLKKLRKDANSLCNTLNPRYLPTITEPVNWPDLRCEIAEQYTNSNGQTGYRVYVGEAAPSCKKLQEFIAQQLGRMGYKETIEVITVW